MVSLKPGFPEMEQKGKQSQVWWTPVTPVTQDAQVGLWFEG